MGGGGGGTHNTKAAGRPAEVHPEQAQRRRGVRDLPADQIRWAETVLAGGRGVGDPDDGRGDRPGRRSRPRRGPARS